MNNRVFLSKGGSIHGPYTSTEIESFIQSGTIHQFSWMWNGQRKAWDPLDPAPTQNPESQIDTGTNQLQTPVSTSAEGSPVLIYSYSTLVSGNIQVSNITGCEVFIKKEHHGYAPKLALSSQVKLNQEAPNGSLLEQIAKVILLEPKNNGWIIRLRWVA